MIKHRLFLILLICAACGTQDNETEGTMFRLMNSEESGISFENTLTYDRNFNIYKYRNFYNGGGVGIADVNNDGLQDIYFNSNLSGNKLYLNKGDFKFEDITEQAGVAGTRAWSTGVAMADINGDGWMDIYVCNSGDIAGDNKQNELFVNNGDLTFTESAASYGIDDQGYSTHAAFFDYDKDGDLDLYLLNNSYQAIGSFNLMRNERPNRDPVGGDKLFRNDDGLFMDVSEEANIYGSIIGFGLGVTIGDVNRDGWMDIYVSNDFFERDYLYINQQDGSFRDELEDQMQSISAASMGADMADINGDGYPEVFVTEMLPEPDHRLKTVTTFESWDRYQYNIKNGYYHQFTRNTLQLNNGNNTFSEIGRMAGVHATDWSWGALINDFDNDGLSDIFVANGIYQDLTNQDYLQFASNEETMKSIIQDSVVDFKRLIDVIPSVRIPNYMFKNQGNYAFENMAQEWGLATPSHSNGSAYADLDNDGDLDLVVNNVNMPAFLYRNTLDTDNFLRVNLEGAGKNTMGVGATVRVFTNGSMQVKDHVPTRGFQSSMEYGLHFGLGDYSTIDSVRVVWPSGNSELKTAVSAGTTVTFVEADAQESWQFHQNVQEGIFRASEDEIDYRHKENDFVDFDRDRLIFHMLSSEGPAAARGDINGDGLADVIIGGAKDQPAGVFLQQKNGYFTKVDNPEIEKHATSEDVDCLLFDADGDTDLDLYVASGGNEFSTSSPALADRLYLNDGSGIFTFTNTVYPAGRFESTTAVTGSDFDKDGDIDLFVGVRLRPRFYGVPSDGYILQNDGKGNFTVLEDASLTSLGMVTDAAWSDTDGDGDSDLVIVGEYMPVTILVNNVNTFSKVELAGTSGWWNTLHVEDLDGDGDTDIVAGNLGTNSRFKASQEQPLTMWINDFDGNGTAEQIISSYNGDQSYPMVLKHDLVMQMPGLKKKYLKYESYKGQTVEDIFELGTLENAVKLQASTFETSVFMNDGNNSFSRVRLPREAQISPVYAIAVEDFDGDGTKDILLGGNLHNVKPEVGRYDGSYGVLLRGLADGDFKHVNTSEFGEPIHGQVREFLLIDRKVVVIKNDDQPQTLVF